MALVLANDLARFLSHLWLPVQTEGLDVDEGCPRFLGGASTSAALTGPANRVTEAGEPAPETQWVVDLDDYHAIGPADLHERRSSDGARQD